MDRPTKLLTLVWLAFSSLAWAQPPGSVVDPSGATRVSTLQRPTYNVAFGALAAADRDVLSVFNASGSGRVIRVVSIRASAYNTGAVTGASNFALYSRTSTAGSTCTSITIDSLDTSNPSLPAQITASRDCTTDPTVSVNIGACAISSDEATMSIFANANPYCYQFLNNGGQPITLREGEGLMLKQSAVAGGGVVLYVIEFTVSTN